MDMVVDIVGWVRGIKISNHALMRYVQINTGVPEFDTTKMHREWEDIWRNRLRKELANSRRFERKNAAYQTIKHNFKKAYYYKSTSGVILVIGVNGNEKMKEIITVYVDEDTI